MATTKIELIRITAAVRQESAILLFAIGMVSLEFFLLSREMFAL
jgi:hypothetical protein